MARIKYVFAVASRGTEDMLAGKFRESDLPKFEKAGYKILEKKDVPTLKNDILGATKEIKKAKSNIKFLKSKKYLPHEVPVDETPAPTVEPATVDEAPKKKRGRPKKVVAPVEPEPVPVPAVHVEETPAPVAEPIKGTTFTVEYYESKTDRFRAVDVTAVNEEDARLSVFPEASRIVKVYPKN